MNQSKHHNNSRIGEYAEEYLFQRASEIVHEKTCDSTVFDVHAESEVPRFEEYGETIIFYA